MKLSRFQTWILVIALALGGGAFLWKLFALRFQAGDSYEPYSTLRSDSLGVRVLYESLKSLPEFETSRSYKAKNGALQPAKTALLFLGVSAQNESVLQNGREEELVQFAREGGRLVMSLNPAPSSLFQTARENSRKRGRAKKETNSVPEKAENIEPSMESETGKKSPDFETISRVLFKSSPRDRDETEVADLQIEERLPETLKWPGPNSFQTNVPEWKIVYTVDERPVVFQRSIGKGQIVLMSDSYLLSNEAMVKDRSAQFIEWVLGNRHIIVFDEYHLGTQEDHGIATLIRKYRLEKIVLALAVLVVLFIWRQGCAFLPPFHETQTSSIRIGHDSTLTLARMLQKNILPEKILQHCWDRWKRSLPPKHRFSATSIQAAESLVASDSKAEIKNRDPVQIYKQAAQILSPTKKL
jgi:hypothetical protein